MRQLEQYYQILELPPGATLEEVNEGYKDLVLVWHPDRFANHPRLQKKAHAKIQEINEAREQLQVVSHKTTISTARSKFTARATPVTQTPVKTEEVKQTWQKYNPRTIQTPVPASSNRSDTSGWLD